MIPTPDDLRGLADDLDNLSDSAFVLRREAAGSHVAVDAITSAQDALDDAAETLREEADVLEEADAEDGDAE